MKADEPVDQRGDFDAAVDRVGDVLRSAIRATVECLPSPAQRMMEMARHLELSRGITQRVVSAVREDVPAGEVLSRLPGVDGLRKFAEAAQRSVGSTSELRELWNAIDAYEGLILGFGGSQSALLKRLRSKGHGGGLPTVNSDGPGWDSETLRKQLFSAAAEVAGNYRRASLLAHVFTLTTDDHPEVVDKSCLRVLDIVRGPHGLPGRVMNAVDPDSSIDTGGDDGTIEPGPRFVPSLCSDALPNVTRRSSERGSMKYYAGQAAHANTASLTMESSTRRGPAPGATVGERTLYSRISIGAPTGMLVIDHYLHHSLARRALSTAGHRLSSALGNSASSADDMWVTKLPSQLGLKSLGSGFTPLGDELRKPHAELVEYLFTSLGWDPDEFVLSRLQIPYPIWLSTYFVEASI